MERIGVSMERGWPGGEVWGQALILLPLHPPWQKGGSLALQPQEVFWGWGGSCSSGRNEISYFCNVCPMIFV